MLCPEVTILEVAEKRYDCISGNCIETPGGQYLTSNCDGQCSLPPPNNNNLIFIAAGLGLAYIILSPKGRRSK